jgi:hypothetical protein
MKPALNWFVFGVYIVTGVTMLFFGTLFLRHVCLSLWMSDGLIAFPSFLFGVTLHMVGGGILLSTLARLSKRAAVRKYA